MDEGEYRNPWQVSVGQVPTDLFTERDLWHARKNWKPYKSTWLRIYPPIWYISTRSRFGVGQITVLSNICSDNALRILVHRFIKSPYRLSVLLWEARLAANCFDLELEFFAPGRPSHENPNQNTISRRGAGTQGGQKLSLLKRRL